MDATYGVPAIGAYVALTDPVTIEELQLLRLSDVSLPLVLEKLKSGMYPKLRTLKLTFMSIKNASNFAELVTACKDRLVGITASTNDRDADPFQEVVRDALGECPNLVNIEFTGCEKGHDTDLVELCATSPNFKGKLQHIGVREKRTAGKHIVSPQFYMTDYFGSNMVAPVIFDSNWYRPRIPPDEIFGKMYFRNYIVRRVYYEYVSKVISKHRKSL